MRDRRCPKNTFRPRTDSPAVVYTQEVNFAVGTWLSLVEHSLGVRGVGSSNLPVPTITSNQNVGLVLPALAAYAAGLQQHQGQREAGVKPPVAVAAAHRILQQQKTFDILDPKTRQAKTGRRAFGTGHLSSPASAKNGYNLSGPRLRLL